MKSRFIAARTLVGVMLFSVVMFAQQPNAPQAMKKNFVEPVQRGGERHPEIRKAIDALEAAKGDLQRANHDFGGHRAEALRACDEAIKQLREALNYDRK